MNFRPRRDLEGNNLGREMLEVFVENLSPSEDVEGIRLALEQSDWDLNRFFGERKYELIRDVESRNRFIRYDIFGNHIIMWYHMCDCNVGYYDLFTHDEDLVLEDGRPLTESEILRLLYYARSNGECWDLLMQGVGDINSYWRYLSLKPEGRLLCAMEPSEERAMQFLHYVLMNGGTTKRDEEYFLTDTPDRRREAYEILVQKYHLECQELFEDWGRTIGMIRHSIEYSKKYSFVVGDDGKIYDCEGNVAYTIDADGNVYNEEMERVLTIDFPDLD